MLNLLTKTKPWMVASLLVATSVFGQDAGASGQKPGAAKCDTKTCAPKADCKPKCPQPCPPTQLCPAPTPSPCCPPWPVPVLNAAYNYPARVQTRCPWDVFADASFIYWQPLQENLELGIVGTIPSGGNATTQLSGNVLDMNYSYKPGFKVGLGGFFEYDNWDLRAEYTWFHNQNQQSYSYDAVATQTQAIYPLRGHPGFQGSNVYNSVAGKWRLHMDLVDLDMGRWHYVGTKLVFHTTFGARGAFIRQNFNTTLVNSGAFPLGTKETTITKDTSHSWAVGPKMGLDTFWHLGQGFRIFGCGEADLLYTRYTKINNYQDHQTASATTKTVDVNVNQKNAGCLRPHVGLKLGLGWGTYWDCNNWFTDIALGYEFQVFFDQNVMRQYQNPTMLGNSNTANGNLYTQGLTATFSLNF